MPPAAVAALKHTISVYGYIVVAWDHPVEVGAIFNQFAGEWSTAQPFQVVAKTTYEEWLEHIKESERFGYVNRNPFPGKDYFFYRAVTE
jgi:hypothetical protein